MAEISEQELQNVIQSFEGASFSTYDFVLNLKRMYPVTWNILEEEYGAGGKGANTRFSAYSRIAHALNKVANTDDLNKLDYRPAPNGWGSPKIRFWAVSTMALGGQDFPEEILTPDTVTGAKLTVVINKYERNRNARFKCIEKWGVSCVVCGFNFENFYGKHGAGYIHVHHLRPLAEIGKEYQLDPINDLRPICPNCHAMIHYFPKGISIEELKEKVRAVNVPKH